MDYSVGSLADLISGSNTPNKPKVIKKEFKEEVFDTYDNPKSSAHKIAKKKKIKREVDVDSGNTLENSLKKENKLKKRSKVLKNKIIKNEEDVEPQPLKKNKRKKLKLKPADENNSINAEDLVKDKQKKGKKRKLEKSIIDADFVDSDDGSPAKKEKLTDFQQNAERRVKKKNNEEKKIRDPEELARTIFVGNIPIKIEKKHIKRHFKKYGIIESVRIRGIPVADPKTSKKVAAIKKEFNPNRSNIYCYVRYENKEDALKAEAENGALFMEHHLRVHSCSSEDKPDETKAIFVGNLSFDAVEDELWKLFEQCGPISYVRIIRDTFTGMGKGFAYVNFKDSDAVQLALEMENVKLKDRELRISLCNHNVAKKTRKFKTKKIAPAGQKQEFRKNLNKNSYRETSDRQNGKTKEVRAEFQGSKFSDKKKIAPAGQKQKFRKNLNRNSYKETSDRKYGNAKEVSAEFQGSKFSDKKKKRKINKGLLEKKKLVKKIAPNPK